MLEPDSSYTYYVNGLAVIRIYSLSVYLPLNSKPRYSPVSWPVGCLKIQEGNMAMLDSSDFKPMSISRRKSSRNCFNSSVDSLKWCLNSSTASIWASEPVVGPEEKDLRGCDMLLCEMKYKGKRTRRRRNGRIKRKRGVFITKLCVE